MNSLSGSNFNIKNYAFQNSNLNGPVVYSQSDVQNGYVNHSKPAHVDESTKNLEPFAKSNN